MNITAKTKVKRNETLIESESAGEAVMLDLEKGAYFGLNDVGTRIYQLCEQPTDLEAIRAALLEEFEVNSEQCNEELLEFVERMIGHNLLQIVT